ncbi:hypothetical protein FKP32DRAFT_1590916 [Trametes sanguinea]|nr:hypothetical protein FKP32DRAFT_1590916 [Trametes sanguinea]
MREEYVVYIAVEMYAYNYTSTLSIVGNRRDNCTARNGSRLGSWFLAFLCRRRGRCAPLSSCVGGRLERRPLFVIK